MLLYYDDDHMGVHVDVDVNTAKMVMEVFRPIGWLTRLFLHFESPKILQITILSF